MLAIIEAGNVYIYIRMVFALCVFRVKREREKERVVPVGTNINWNLVVSFR